MNIGSVSNATYTVTNSGTGTLSLGGSPRVTISGSSDFSVTSQPASTVSASGGTTTFVVRFAPSAASLVSATISIQNDDTNENPYDFRVQGTGVATTDTDGDGTPDVIDTDDDNDGVSDAQEILDGSNPNDRGSGSPLLPVSFCSDWNGYLGMANINEYYSSAASVRNLTLTMYDRDGNALGATGAQVPAGSQFDVIVNQLQGFAANDYGRSCTDVTGGAPGDIDGRVVLYRPSASGFDFAVALPFFAGRTQSQFVQYNTYDPSLSTSYPAANWITVINDDAGTASGVLHFYNQDGSELGSTALTLPSGGRRDFSPTQFGVNRVGLAEWRPDSATTKFVVRNIRYYPDSAAGNASFYSALALEGYPGNGEPMIVALDKRNGSAVLELSNALGEVITVDATYRSSAGAVLGTQTIGLLPYETTHIIADGFLTTEVGSVTLDGSLPSSVIASALHYTRDSSLRLKNAYAMRSIESRGAALRASYNTHLGQGCDLLLVSSSNSSVTSSVTMTRQDGTVVASGVQVVTPARGVTSYDLCANDGANNYGAVVVVPNVVDALSGAVIRHGASDRYQFATQMR